MLSYNEVQVHLKTKLIDTPDRFGWSLRDVFWGVRTCQDNLSPEEWQSAPSLLHEWRTTPLKSDKVAYAYFLERSQCFTVGEFLTILNKETFMDDGTYGWPSHRRVRELSLGKGLVRMGVTAVEYIRMPKRSVTSDYLRQIPRHKLLQLDARVIPTVSDRLIRCLADSSRYSLEFQGISVEQLNACDQDIVGRWLSQETIALTAALFAELGFSSNECVFIELATHDEFLVMLSRHQKSLEKRQKRLTTAMQKLKKSLAT